MFIEFSLQDNDNLLHKLCKEEFEEQTTQWPKEKVQKYKQRYTKHTHKTKDRVTRTPLITDQVLRKME